MKRALIFVSTLTLAFALTACEKNDKAGDTNAETDTAAARTTDSKSAKTEDKKSEVGEMSVDALAGLIDKTDKVAVLDSNGAATRKKYGKIPGATLLTDYQSFDKSELPEDKAAKLIFYCSNTQCGASHASAKVAMAEGYKDVHVLPAGIMGWKEAGQKTETVQ
jgi:rhodanese-related sulfurtransferase